MKKLVWLCIVLSSTLASTAFAAPNPEVLDCTTAETTEMTQAIDWGAKNWIAFERYLEYAADANIKKCLENRFKKNGKVVCEANMKGLCTRSKGPSNAWASPFNKRCHLCPDFRHAVRESLSGPQNANNRKACYFAVITHEWAHTCERRHKKAEENDKVEKIDNGAFDFWKSKHPEVTIELGDCGMD